MGHVRQHRNARRRASLRAAAVALALGGITASVLPDGTAIGAPSHKAKSVVISTSDNPTLGTILVSGTTVYTLKAGMVACKAKCVKVWPEVLLPKGVKKAKAGPGVNGAELGAVKRRGGVRQVTYAGRPLYWFLLTPHRVR